ncbi:MAG: hypothetical protein P8X47_12200, partial [Ignavibacteriaceae bacterium]
MTKLHYFFTNVIVIVSILFLTFCSKTDKNKFKDLYNDITSIKGTLNVDPESNIVSNKYQQLATNLARIDTSDLNDTGKELYYYFTIYLQLYLDSKFIKEVVTEFTPSNFPSNLIFLRRGPLLTKKDLDLTLYSTVKYDQVCLIVEKYNLPVYKIELAPTQNNRKNSIFDGAYYKTLDTLGFTSYYSE